MKFIRLLVPAVSIMLLLITAVPALASDPPDIDAKVTVQGNNVDMEVDINASNSKVSINHGAKSSTTVNGYTGSTTDVNLNNGPQSVIKVVQGDNIPATINGYEESTTNVNIDGGPNASVSVVQGACSQTTINGGSNSVMTVNAGSDYIVNLNGTNIHSQIESLRLPQGWNADWNENVRIVNKVVLPKLDNLNKNADLLFSAVSKLILEGKATDEDLKNLRLSINALKAEAAQIQSQHESILADIIALQAADSEIQTMLVNVEDRLGSRLYSIENNSGRQSQSIDQLFNRLKQLEEQQKQEKYVREHSGFAYRVKSFFTSFPAKVKNFFVGLTGNMMNLAMKP